ncbi:hypothetical protein DUNSADRAFT_16286 [Dunaliella salina]|uniref:RING-type domain-containing protein n=1 Tax=Dunaliella salina TaxID=3046 RepID=A0ABQ7G3X9_DUNSA|nr:hypothetical protein DUNSADRAFT_16286 [Dunaliella salina]|eukprot:KAF5829306.1 hypothetical protein DUNSADRAFT_16286 [Dunaliella salina]
MSAPGARFDDSLNDARDECIICLSAPIERGFLHGNDVYFCVCKACSQANIGDPCPLCRMPIERIINVFSAAPSKSPVQAPNAPAPNPTAPPLSSPPPPSASPQSHPLCLLPTEIPSHSPALNPSCSSLAGTSHLPPHLRHLLRSSFAPVVGERAAVDSRVQQQEQKQQQEDQEQQEQQEKQEKQKQQQREEQQQRRQQQQQQQGLQPQKRKDKKLALRLRQQQQQQHQIEQKQQLLQQQEEQLAASQQSRAHPKQKIFRLIRFGCRSICWAVSMLLLAYGLLYGTAFLLGFLSGLSPEPAREGKSGPVQFNREHVSVIQHLKGTIHARYGEVCDHPAFSQHGGSRVATLFRTCNECDCYDDADLDYCPMECKPPTAYLYPVYSHDNGEILEYPSVGAFHKMCAAVRRMNVLDKDKDFRDWYQQIHQFYSGPQQEMGLPRTLICIHMSILELLEAGFRKSM